MTDFQVYLCTISVLFAFCAGSVFTLLLTCPGLFDTPDPHLRFGDELPETTATPGPKR